MKWSRSRVFRGVLVALALLALAGPSVAQQSAPTPAAPVETPAADRPATVEPGAPPAPSALTPPGARSLPRELSPWSMFLSADILVKAVMVSLALASVVTWTIFLAMRMQLFAARRRLRGALRPVAGAATLGEARLALGRRRNVLASLVAAALDEVRASGDGADEGGIKERAAMRFSEIVRAEARAARRGMGILATIGAVSPFVGLFGTVWGIMNSFIGISKSQTTNLAVVAPGIAEALLATAIGLVAAIPAVIISTHFARVTRSYLDVVRHGSGVVGRLLSRDLDRAGRGMMARAAE